MKQLDDLLGMLGRVERFLERRSPARWRLRFRRSASASLDAGRVAQDERGHLDGRGRGEDRPAMTALGQQRQPAGVVQVAVREQHGVELLPAARWAGG